jgi:hypothetical protein
VQFLNINGKKLQRFFGSSGLVYFLSIPIRAAGICSVDASHPNVSCSVGRFFTARHLISCVACISHVLHARRHGRTFNGRHLHGGRSIGLERMRYHRRNGSLYLFSMAAMGVIDHIWYLVMIIAGPMHDDSAWIGCRLVAVGNDPYFMMRC